jgi:hypothetical protein
LEGRGSEVTVCANDEEERHGHASMLAISSGCAKGETAMPCRALEDKRITNVEECSDEEADIQTCRGEKSITA